MDPKKNDRGPGLWILVCALSLWALTVNSSAQTKPPAKEAGPSAPRPAEPLPELTEKQVELVLEMVGVSRPALAERLRQLKQSDAHEFRRAVRRLAEQERTRRLITLQETDPEGFKVRLVEWRSNAESTALARDLRRVKSPDEAEKLKPRLRESVERQFESRLKVREHELAQLEKRLHQLRDKLQQTRQRREELIAEQYQKMLTGKDSTPER